jgi:hypothetical protein
MPSEARPPTRRRGLGAAPAAPSGQYVHQKGHDSHYGYHDGYNDDRRDSDDHVVPHYPTVLRLKR